MKNRGLNMLNEDDNGLHILHRFYFPRLDNIIEGGVYSHQFDKPCQ